MRWVFLWLLLLISAARAQSPGTLNLQSTQTGAPLITPSVVNNAVNAALGLKADYPGPFSSPPPIGNVTPNTGAFSTLNATGQVLFGNNAFRVDPGNGSLKANQISA